MPLSFYDLETFYDIPCGQFVSDTLKPFIHTEHNTLSIGYTAPFELKNELCASPFVDHDTDIIVDLTALPFDKKSIEHIVMMHALEFSPDPQKTLHEVSRILQPNATITIVTPNTGGTWAGNDQSPFGYGIAFSMETLFDMASKARLRIHEQHGALYLPPRATYGFFANAIEKIGETILPFGYGLHILTLEKTTYAPADPPNGLKIRDFLPGFAKPSVSMEIKEHKAS